MLLAKSVAAVVFIWIIAAVLGGLYEGSWLGGTERSLLNQVLFYDIVTVEGTWGVTQLAGSPLGYIEALWKLATFQFSFVSGDWEVIRWIVFGPLTAYVVYGIIMTVIAILRGTIGGT